MKLSEILRLAADEHLSEVDEPIRSDFGSIVKARFSCDAVRAAVHWTWVPGEDFLKSLGCPVYSIHAFDEFPAGIERQSVRYAWLHMAADYAEECGL